jgi:hypothetical protein
MMLSDMGVLICSSRFSSVSTVLDHVETLPRAGRAGDDVHPPMPEPQRFQDLEADLHLLDGIGGQRHAHRVPQPRPEQAAKPDGGFHRAADEAAGFRDAKVKRRIGLFGQHLVGRNRHEDVRGLHGDLEVQKIVVLEDLDVIEARFDHRVGTGLAILVQQVLFEAPGIHPDPDRAIMVAGGLDDLLHPLLVADIAGVDPQAGRARLRASIPRL